MAKKPALKLVSKKAPAASKKAAAKKAVAKKVAVKKSASKKAAASKRPSTSSTGEVRLGWTIGKLGVEEGIAGLYIGDRFYPFNYNMGYPICFLFPIRPEPGRDPDYEAALEAQINCEPMISRTIQPCATCCN